MTKNFARRALYLKNNTLNTLHHMIFVYCANVQKDNISSWFFFFFFSFFQNFNFLGCKGAKNSPKWQKIMSAALHISGIIRSWFWFLVHMCKMITSPGTFFIFSFYFPGCWGDKMQKLAQMTKHFVPLTPYLRTWLRFLVHMCKMMIFPELFFHFFKILIFGVFIGVRGQKMTQIYQFKSVALYVYMSIDHIIKICGTQV